MRTKTGDLLANVHEGLIVHQVNAQGVMGSGFAKACRERYPNVWTDYEHEVKNFTGERRSLMGKVIVSQASPMLLVISIVGQLHFGRDGDVYTDYNALRTGFEDLRRLMDAAHATSLDVHHPRIGAGLGGGDWKIIAPMIESVIGPETTLWTLPGL